MNISQLKLRSEKFDDNNDDDNDDDNNNNNSIMLLSLLTIHEGCFRKSNKESVTSRSLATKQQTVQVSLGKSSIRNEPCTWCSLHLTLRFKRSVVHSDLSVVEYINDECYSGTKCASIQEAIVTYFKVLG